GDNTTDGEENDTEGRDNTTDGDENDTESGDNTTDGDENGTEGGDNTTDNDENGTDGGDNTTDSDENESVEEDDGLLTYEEYIALSGEEQQAYFQSFDTYQEFFDWFNAAKAKYDEEHKGDNVGEDGNIDIGG
ncbi:MAG: hypothetical protein J6Q68_03270, partial [Clostridia bacterium]|nr:hypothetical protein [Clostridia bacterium]